MDYNKIDEETRSAFVEFEKYMKDMDIKLPRVMPNLLGKNVLTLPGLFVAGFNAGRESK